MSVTVFETLVKAVAALASGIWVFGEKTPVKREKVKSKVRVIER